MANDGKRLEALVSFIEKLLVPKGFEVKTNERVHNDEGVQIAEFDVEIRGKIGSTDIAWLIECRDRPGQGAAPGAWIEQLVGRRDRFGFNKVTAVSTTGFAAGAAEFAAQRGIELREVAALEPGAFSEWLQLGAMTRRERVANLFRASLMPRDASRLHELETHLAALPADAAFLRSLTTGETFSAKEAFLGAVLQGNLFDGLTVSGPAKQILLDVQYSLENDCFVIDTGDGPLSISAIKFQGELLIRELQVPLLDTAEYRHLQSQQAISQVATFSPQDINGRSLAFELHRVMETGEIHVVVRPVPAK